VAQTHRWLLSYLRGQDQPYDAVLCFSQGGAVAASLILHHNNEHPGEALPFRAVIFICGGVPLPVLADLGLPISSTAWAVSERTGRELWEMAATAETKIAARRAKTDSPAGRQGLWDRPVMMSEDPDGPGGENESHESHESHDPHALPPLDPGNVYGLDLTRFPDSFRIDMPTVHIYGRKDPRCPAALQLALMSAADQRLVYDHGGGHEIPRTTPVSEAIADAVCWLEARLGRSDSWR
jgi:pimeloyl-ACP methyl ester carboxylesterase